MELDPRSYNLWMHRDIETVAIIGSGPAALTAAIYAARAAMHPIVYEGAISEENRIAGTLPLFGT